MSARWLLLATISLGGCAELFSIDRLDDVADAGAGTDADLVAPWGPWSSPQPIANIKLLTEEDPSLTDDGLSIYFTSNASGMYLAYRATRASTSDAFGTPLPVDELNAQGATFGSVTGDDLAFYYHATSARGDVDIWVMTRTTPDEPFANPVLVTAFNSVISDFNAAVASNGLFATVTRELTVSDRELDLYSRPSTDDVWTPADGAAPLQSPFRDSGSSLSGDALTVVFHSDRDSPGSFSDLYIAERATSTSSFAAATRIDELSTEDHETDPFLSKDATTIVFARSGTIYEATRSRR